MSNASILLKRKSPCLILLYYSNYFPYFKKNTGRFLLLRACACIYFFFFFDHSLPCTFNITNIIKIANILNSKYMYQIPFFFFFLIYKREMLLRYLEPHCLLINKAVNMKNPFSINTFIFSHNILNIKISLALPF